MTLEEFIKDNGGWWGEYEEAPVEDWKYEVAGGETRKGYWEWAAAIWEGIREDQGFYEKMECPTNLACARYDK